MLGLSYQSPREFSSKAHPIIFDINTALDFNQSLSEAEFEGVLKSPFPFEFKTLSDRFYCPLNKFVKKSFNDELFKSFDMNNITTHNAFTFIKNILPQYIAFSIPVDEWKLQNSDIYSDFVFSLIDDGAIEVDFEPRHFLDKNDLFDFVEALHIHSQKKKETTGYKKNKRRSNVIQWKDMIPVALRKSELCNIYQVYNKETKQFIIVIWGYSVLNELIALNLPQDVFDKAFSDYSLMVLKNYRLPEVTKILNGVSGTSVETIFLQLRDLFNGKLDLNNEGKWLILALIKNIQSSLYFLNFDLEEGYYPEDKYSPFQVPFTKELSMIVRGEILEHPRFSAFKSYFLNLKEGRNSVTTTKLLQFCGLLGDVNRKQINLYEVRNKPKKIDDIFNNIQLKPLDELFGNLKLKQKEKEDEEDTLPLSSIMRMEEECIDISDDLCNYLRKHHYPIYQFLLFCKIGPFAHEVNWDFHHLSNVTFLFRSYHQEMKRNAMMTFRMWDYLLEPPFGVPEEVSNHTYSMNGFFIIDILDKLTELKKANKPLDFLRFSPFALLTYLRFLNKLTPSEVSFLLDIFEFATNGMDVTQFIHASTNEGKLILEDHKNKWKVLTHILFNLSSSKETYELIQSSLMNLLSDSMSFSPKISSKHSPESLLEYDFYAQGAYFNWVSPFTLMVSDWIKSVNEYGVKPYHYTDFISMLQSEELSSTQQINQIFPIFRNKLEDLFAQLFSRMADYTYNKKSESEMYQYYLEDNKFPFFYKSNKTLFRLVDNIKETVDALIESNIRGETSILPRVEHLLCNNGFIKPYIQASPIIEKQLLSLKSDFPNFADVVDYYIAQLRLGNHLRGIKPILLLGEAGLGKTKFSKSLASILGSDFQMVNIPSLFDQVPLVGASSVYRGAKQGLIFDALTRSKTANPVVLLDEVDKSEKSRGSNIFNILHTLLEPESSEKFSDEFFQFEMDASKIIYIATANDLSSLSSSLLSRFELFKIQRPSKEALLSIIDRMWLKIIDGHDLPTRLSNEIKEEMVNNNLRDISKFLEKIANKLIQKSSVVMKDSVFVEQEVTGDIYSHEYILKDYNNGLDVFQSGLPRLTNHLDGEITQSDVHEMILEQRKINLEINNDAFNLVSPFEINYSLEDVKGCDEAKKQIKELITLFNSSDLSLGLNRPKGLIIYGAPGVGKTMMAKAFAKEVNMPFIALSASNFADKYVGEGARKVRQLFEKARQYAPCIIFIDEIDALGNREESLGEKNNTLNEILIQLDGAKSNDGVFVIGSTNFLSRLDKALIRPGRFDRKIEISLPSLEGRKQLIDSISEKFDIESGLTDHIAKLTYGFSGAKLVNLFNQSAIIAIRRHHQKIQLDDIEEAIDEIDMGIKTFKESDQDKRITAYHEIGHAVIGYLLKYCHPVHKVTVVPRANALGVTRTYPESESFNTSKEKLLDDICMILGGRAAEKIFIGQISTGASGDIKMVTSRATKMVKEWGLSDDDLLTTLIYDSQDNLSNELRHRIEMAVYRIVSEQMQRAERLLNEYKPFCEELTQLLLEKEEIFEQDIDKIAEKFELTKQSIC